MDRVTGLGGVFLKAKDAKSLCAWYEKHLGIPFGGSTYVSFEWVNHNNPDEPGSSVFSFFKEDSNYFNPSASPFMINFRVKDLSALLEQLKSEGVQPHGDMIEEDYGKFAWIIDPEGNKVELWEPK
jgi:predicted enzyme related to lactoylglutathione lyase